MKIKILPDGTAHCLYTEKINLQALGVLDITRASHVEYDNSQQGWTVTLASGEIFPQVYPTRAQALRAEVSYLEDRL